MATVRTETDEAVVFTTLDDLPIVPVKLAHVAHLHRRQEARRPERRGRERPRLPGIRRAAEARRPAAHRPVRGGAGERGPPATSAAASRASASIRPGRPSPGRPGRATTGRACELERDTTGGLNRDGDVVVHVPVGHARLGRREAPGRAGSGRASRSPRRASRSTPRRRRSSGSPASTVGGTTDAVHADVVVDEIIGTSEGVAGQRFLLKRRPVVPGDRPTAVRVADDEDGWQEWTQVRRLLGLGPVRPAFRPRRRRRRDHLRARGSRARRRGPLVWRRAAEGPPDQGSTST